MADADASVLSILPASPSHASSSSRSSANKHIYLVPHTIPFVKFPFASFPSSDSEKLATSTSTSTRRPAPSTSDLIHSMRNWDDENRSSPHSQISKSSSPSTSKSKMASQEPKITTSSIDVADASSDPEKNIALVHSTASEAVSKVPSAPSVPFDVAATKKLLRKLDLHLIPFLALIYL